MLKQEIADMIIGISIINLNAMVMVVVVMLLGSVFVYTTIKELFVMRHEMMCIIMYMYMYFNFFCLSQSNTTIILYLKAGQPV